jgi:protein-tyrosine-phosphatase
MLHALMTTGAVGRWPAATPGIVARQLARDVDWLEHVLRRNAPARLVKLPSLGQVLRDGLLVLSPRHHFDVQQWRDPWPGIVDLGRLVRTQWRRLTGRLAHAMRLRQERRRATALQRVWSQSAQPPYVLFLCYGNINRSALAQAYAQARLPGPTRFASAGFHSPEGRPADPVMVDVARNLAVRLDSWQSHTLTAAMVQRADLILAMEVAHLDRLKKAHPEARQRSCLLDSSGAEIPDPYGHDRSQYERVAQRVCAAVDRWFPLATFAPRTVAPSAPPAAEPHV